MLIELNLFKKNKWNEIKICSRKCNNITDKGKLSKSKIKANKYTTKQIELYSKYKSGTISKIKKKNFQDEELPH